MAAIDALAPMSGHLHAYSQLQPLLLQLTENPLDVSIDEEASSLLQKP